MATSLPALDVRGPNIDVVGAQTRALQLRDLQNRLSMFPVQQQQAQTQLQSEQADLQMKQLAVKDQSIWSDALRQSGGDLEHAGELARQNGASYNSIIEHNTGLAKMRQANATATKDENENIQTQHTNASNLLNGILEKSDDQLESEYNAQMGILRSNPAMAQKSYGLDANNLPPFTNRKDLQEHADILEGVSKVRKEKAEEDAASGSWMRGVAAKQNADREANNPPPGTVTDAMRFVQQQENARALLAQTNRAQAEGQQPVIGREPTTGRTLLMSAGEAKDKGLQYPMKADAADQAKALSARQFIPLSEGIGNAPENMGILQLIDKMDREGKLGTVASRWNEFVAGRVGAGDPEFEALRTKVGLSNSLLMNLHMGARGASAMLEHFEDLANAKKMNAETLRTGIASELNYAKDRAMQVEPAARHIRYDPQGVAYEWSGRGDGSNPNDWTRLP
jgi:hypothetical protein